MEFKPTDAKSLRDAIGDALAESRAATDGLCALGLRFTEDPLVPAQRFKTLVAQEYADIIYNGLWFSAFHQDLAAFVLEHLPRLKNGSVLAVTSKIAALAEMHFVAVAPLGRFDPVLARGRRHTRKRACCPP